MTSLSLENLEYRFCTIYSNVSNVHRWLSTCNICKKHMLYGFFFFNVFTVSLSLILSGNLSHSNGLLILWKVPTCGRSLTLPSPVTMIQFLFWWDNGTNWWQFMSGNVHDNECLTEFMEDALLHVKFLDPGSHTEHCPPTIYSWQQGETNLEVYYWI